MTTSQTPNLTLSTPLQLVPGVGPIRAKKMRRMGLRIAQDLLFLFPRDYEFPAPAVAVANLQEGQSASLVGCIADAELVSRTAGKTVFGALLETESGFVRMLFFNQPFRAEQLTLGRKVMIDGAPKLNGLRMEFVHPKVTILDDQEDLPQPKILPIYPLTDGIKQPEMRRLVSDIVRELSGELTEVLPDRIRLAGAQVMSGIGIPISGTDQLPSIDRSLCQLHMPDDRDSLVNARTRLVFQELLVMQLALAMRRRKLTTDLRAPPLAPSAMIDARILKRFPFDLTGDQARAIREIGIDMSRQFPMNRLLQGDVGSGKTVVAIYAMMLAVAHGRQAVLMAPTELLARQHQQTISRILSDSRVRVGLLCGTMREQERRDTFAGVSSGEIDLLVGTQALLHQEIEFAGLGLCVIDEQHKFGVSQRVALRSGGVDPHYLVMSATPIPRSVAMTMFGDVDLSTLREKPPGRGAVHTYLAHDGWTKRWWTFVRRQLQEGRQAYVVAPRVDEGDDETAASVKKIHEELRSGELSEFNVGLLHGGMPPEEKQAVMQDFSLGKMHVLVSTTVIEVGIDVPNATVMTILGAQRFGLAQLHQLRGRVSRGDHAGHVCVFTDGEKSPEENERLQVFEQTQDGFELAEADFRLRGPGDLLGRKQSGMPPLRIADLQNDIDVLSAAREFAQALIDEDPELNEPDLGLLKAQVLRRYGQSLDLGDVA